MKEIFSWLVAEKQMPMVIYLINGIVLGLLTSAWLSVTAFIRCGSIESESIVCLALFNLCLGALIQLVFVARKKCYFESTTLIFYGSAIGSLLSIGVNQFLPPGLTFVIAALSALGGLSLSFWGIHRFGCKVMLG